MDIILKLFGEGKDLNILQMCMRALVVFFLALILIRLTGRRSFGMKMPFDNVITILLGAILSRAVAGASPFWPTIAASAVLALLHRILAWLAIKSDNFGKLVKGEPRILFVEGTYKKEEMNRFQITDKDIIEEVRVTANIDDMDKIKSVYVERSGELGVIKKEE
jgi:uncharacterized membrane protein YcaP (DUF421 family)